MTSDFEDGARIRLIVTDIEGCINRSELHYDHIGIGKLRGYVNESAHSSGRLPQLALCSGRQYPFVEAVSAMLDLRGPSVFENGAGLFWPLRPLDARIDISAQASSYSWNGYYRSGLLEAVKANLDCSIEIGKEFIVTLHPRRGAEVQDLLVSVRSLLSTLGIEAQVGASASAVDVTPPAVDKGTGIEWLSKAYSVPLSCIAVFGDGVSDLRMFERARVSGAPANADPDIGTHATFRASRSDVGGLLEYIDYVVGRSRS